MIVFIDIILVYSASKEEHYEQFRIVLGTLKNYKLYAKLSKCEFWLQEVKLLGHKVIDDRVSVDPSKVEVVAAWQQPKSVFKTWNFLGLTCYFRRFV